MPEREANRELGMRIRIAREDLGLTQTELATRSGVKIDTLRSIEQGRTPNPGVWTVAKLADSLDRSLDSLVRQPGRWPRNPDLQPE